MVNVSKNNNIITNMSDHIVRTIRVVLIGDTAVGKSTLCQALKGNVDEYMIPNSTIGAEFSTMITDQNIQFELWDTAGQEKYRSLVPLYFRKADIFLLMFDVTQRTSFDSIDSWLDLLQRYTNATLPIVLVGNKIDIRLRLESSPIDLIDANTIDHPLADCYCLSDYNLFQPKYEYISDNEATLKAQYHQIPLFCTSATREMGIDQLKNHLETYARPILESQKSEDSQKSDNCYIPNALGIFQLQFESLTNRDCHVCDIQ
jgi:small GTP-binding protein